MGKNQIQELDNPDPIPSELDKLRFDYAWKWFDLHAKQRMQLFNFFLIITGILASGIVAAYTNELYKISAAISAIGILQTISFFFFDIRSRELIGHAENVLEKLELDLIYKEGFKHLDVREGRQLGLLRHETKTGMRQGFAWERGLKNFLKMKLWIRLLELVIGAAFAASLWITLSA